MVMCLTAQTMHSQSTPQYVDLGLPSGIMWKTTNEKGYYSQDSAKKKFGDKLPTTKQWEELKENCKWTWTGNGYRVTGKNGKSIFLPAAGRANLSYGPDDEDPSGEYWSSDGIAGFEIGLYFDSSEWEIREYLISSLSVRLVQAYVDLGLPSGTKWKVANEDGGLYDWDSAMLKFGDKLPTTKQWEELKKYCTWTWTGNGYKVTGKNGKSIFLRAAGFSFCDGDVHSVGSKGYYWSSTPDGSETAWHLSFGSSSRDVSFSSRCIGQSVRLVQN